MQRHFHDVIHFYNKMGVVGEREVGKVTAITTHRRRRRFSNSFRERERVLTTTSETRPRPPPPLQIIINTPGAYHPNVFVYYPSSRWSYACNGPVDGQWSENTVCAQVYERCVTRSNGVRWQGAVADTIFLRGNYISGNVVII